MARLEVCMPYRIFSIMIPLDESGQKELNAFCGSHRLVTVTHHPVERDGIPYEVFVVEYLDGANDASAPVERGGNHATVDYKKLLSEDDYAVYLRLHKLRKAFATKEAVEVFVIFTNNQLADMAKARCKTLEEMGKIQGVGKARLDKYGKAFLAAIQGEVPSPPSETSVTKEAQPSEEGK